MTMNVLRRLHLAPNGELLREEREAEAARQAEEQRLRQERIRMGKQLGDKIRRGEEDAPLTIDAFMAAAGFTEAQERRFKEREGNADDREY